MKGESHLCGNIVSEKLIEASKLYKSEKFQSWILRGCILLDGSAPVKIIPQGRTEYLGLKREPMLYYMCSQKRVHCLYNSITHLFANNEIYELLKQLIANNLDLKQRTIIKLFYYEGLTQQEISNQLSISKSTVSRKLHQALLTMRWKLHAKGITSIR